VTTNFADRVAELEREVADLKQAVHHRSPNVSHPGPKTGGARLASSKTTSSTTTSSVSAALSAALTQVLILDTDHFTGRRRRSILRLLVPRDCNKHAFKFCSRGHLHRLYRLAPLADLIPGNRKKRTHSILWIVASSPFKGRTNKSLVGARGCPSPSA
jgi:hypothetical protein